MKRIALLLIALAVLVTSGTAVYALTTVVRNSNHARECDAYRTLLKAAWNPGAGATEASERSEASESINKLDAPDRDTLTQAIEGWNQGLAVRRSQSGTGQLSLQEVTAVNELWDRLYDVAVSKGLARKGC